MPEAVAELMPSRSYSTFGTEPEYAEIRVDRLLDTAKVLLTGREGSREKEWSNIISQVEEKGGQAIRIKRGGRAAET